VSESDAAALRALLRSRPIAALGTLHDSEPFVSMVPFAIAGSPPRFVVHVSGLAAHTRDMDRDGRVSLLVTAEPGGDVTPQAVARVTIQGDAARLDEEDAFHAQARAAYLARFPESEPMFGFGDFALFAITPRSARLVGGFAQARSFAAEGIANALNALEG
jgi:putative heme iron utilization protein